jgi:hypothetical protein
MARTRGISDSSGAASTMAPAAGQQLWHTLTKALFDPYRPELHYMRGPGPKWHEKHCQSETHAESPGVTTYRAAH